MKSRFPRLAGATLAACLTLGVAAPAVGAEEDPAAGTEHLTVDQVKERCQKAIDKRLVDLERVQLKLDGAEALTDDHEATLDTIIDDTEAGLTGLSGEIDAATQRVVVAQLCAQIASDYRVYLVVIPQAHLTVAADRSDVAVRIGAEVVEKLDEGIARAAEAGADVTDAEAYRDLAVAHFDAADTANNGVAGAVLAVTPASWNEGPGKVVLDHARADMRTTRAELHGAHDDTVAAVKALRDALGDLA